MSSRNDPSRRKPKWNTNEVCLAIISGIFGLLMLFTFVAIVRGPGGIGDALGGLLCIAVPASVPMFMLWRSRRRGSKSRVMPHLVRSSSFTGHGFADISIHSEQALPKTCIRCGTATRRVSPLRYRGAHTDANPYDWSRVHPLLFLFLAVRFGGQLLLVKIWESIERRLKRRKAAGAAVVFKVPHCKACASRNPIVQRHFDFHGRSMIVEAHPLFREQLKTMSR